jgi:hypothetical protein
MFLFRLQVVSKVVGAMVLIVIGILVSLFIVIVEGGAVPSGSHYVTNPNFMIGSGPSNMYLTLDSNVEIPLTIYLSRRAVSHIVAEWATKPVKEWFLVAAGCLVVIGVLYFLLWRAQSRMSEEIFP